MVDGGNFRVVMFDREGRYLQSFGSVGKQYGQFARPKEIAADREGNVYVVDTAFGNFQIFTADGELLLFVGDRSERDAPAKYMLPSGIAVDEDGLPAGVGNSDSTYRAADCNSRSSVSCFRLISAVTSSRRLISSSAKSSSLVPLSTSARAVSSSRE